MPISTLNDRQRQAVTTTEGPLLIIAGPGTGKTYTLVERIIHLVQENGARPEELLVSTFTEKAAAELITRVSSRLSEEGIRVPLSEMYIGTLHSICLRILDDHREHTRLGRSYTLFDQFDQQYQLYQNIYRYREVENSDLVMGKPQSGRWHQARTLASRLNTVSEELLDTSALKASSDEAVRALGELYDLYHEHLRTENALDFSTIQLEAYRLLQRRPSVANALRSQLRYLMVDEYQDTNTVQEQLLLLLSGVRSTISASNDYSSDKASAQDESSVAGDDYSAEATQQTPTLPNLCVVGDDDQGLYRFRGATIRNILEFPEHFPDGACEQVRLQVNYRSRPGIINFYSDWMEECDWTGPGEDDVFRFDKSLEPRNGVFPPGPSVIKVAGHGESAWHKEVYAFLQHLRQEGTLTDWNQVCFLFRSVKNDKVIALAEYLESEGISVYSPRSNRFFDREEVRLMLGAMIFLFPQFPDVLTDSWKGKKGPAVWNYYDACLSDFIEEVKKPENEELLKWARFRARRHQALGENTDYAFSGLFYEALQFKLFRRYLGEESLGGVVDSRPARNLALFSKLLTKFEYLYRIDLFTPDLLEKHLARFFNYYFRYLKDGGIDEFEDAAEYAPSGCVSFMTVHQAKGLEFPVVMVGSLNGRPWARHTELGKTLQEDYYHKPPFEPLGRMKYFDFWRLYYTAFSRAQSVLALTGAEKDTGSWQMPSKYFREVYNEVPSWRDAEGSLAAVPLKDVEPADLKNEYSFTSHITVFENCARQYKFFKALDFAPVRQSAILFGSLVHHTIEDVHKAVLRGEEHVIEAERIERWFEENYHHLTSKERRFLAPATKRAALLQVQRYVDRNAGDWSFVEEAEVDVSLMKDEYILQGTVDLVEGRGGTVEVVDFKGEKKPDLFMERERIERYRRQLEVYGHIIEERFGKKVSRLHLYFTGEKNGNPRVSFDMDPDSVDETISTFDSVVDQIEEQDFSIDERPMRLCENCDMRYYCDRL